MVNLHLGILKRINISIDALFKTISSLLLLNMSLQKCWYSELYRGQWVAWCGWRGSAVSCDWSRELLQYKILGKNSPIFSQDQLIIRFDPSISFFPISLTPWSIVLATASLLPCGCTGLACWARRGWWGVVSVTILCPPSSQSWAQ